MAQVSARRGAGMWRCECGYVNGDASECERCAASAPSDHREYTIHDLWEAAANDRVAPPRAVSGARGREVAPPVSWDDPGTSRSTDRPKAKRTVVGIIVLNVVFQAAVLGVIQANHLEVRQALELSVGGAVLFYGVLAAWVVRRGRTLGIAPCWSRERPRAAIGTGVAIGAAAAIGVSLVAWLIAGHRVLDPTAAALADQNAGLLALGIFVLAVAAPIVEEIVFRGFYAESMRARGARAAVGWSALAFAIAHLHLIQLPYYGAVGIVLGALYWKHGLVGSISAHAAFNFGLVVVALVANHAPATRVAVDGLSLRVPATWHRVSTAGSDLTMIGPGGAIVVFTHHQLPGSVDLNQLAAALQSGQVTIPNMTVDPSSLSIGQFDLSPALQMTATVHGRRDVITVFASGTQMVEADLFPDGSASAPAAVAKMLGAPALQSDPVRDPRLTVVQQRDLGAGFTATMLPQPPPPESPAVAALVPPACQGPSAPVEAARYDYEHHQPGYANDEVISNTFLMPTPAAVRALRIADQQPAYAACLKAEVTGEVQAGLGPVVSASVTKVNASLPMAGDEFLALVHFRDNGIDRLYTQRIVHLFRGVTAARILVGYCDCRPFPDAATTASAVNHLAPRLVAYNDALGVMP